MRRPGLNGSTIIDDSYSAIPEAVTAALKVLACAKGKKIFVFGGMAELNKKDAISIHEKIGRQAQELGVDELIVIGDLAKHTAGTFGMAKQFDNKQELITYTKTLLADDVTILVKGSRGMRLEEVVAKLVRV
jgi:UDP-N-acetylmuramoyl-tripeptide--D-alanyl-D-alanine ligase